MLRAVANSWQIERPEVMAPVLLSFLNYISLIESIPNQGKDLNSKEWIHLFDNVLIPAINEGELKVKEAEKSLQNIRSKFSNILPLIDESIMKGWSELGKEEQQMQKLSNELGKLSSQASAMGTKITSDAISENKSIITNSVKMLYAAGSAGAEASIPVLGVAIAVITISKGFYDLVKDSEELEKTMREITKIQNELSAEAMGLALTKGTLQVLYNIEKQYLVTQDALPSIINIWANEKTKLIDARDALVGGVAPERYMNIISLPTAQINWRNIDQFIKQLIATDPKVSLPVVLDIEKTKVIQLSTLTSTF